jgi:hypothetical protein
MQVAFSGNNYSKPNIFEMDLHNESIRKLLPSFDALFSARTCVVDLAKSVPSLDLLTTTSDITVKLQYNAGNGGCFPWHYDNPGLPNKRKISMLTYLNPDWKLGDGGELVLKPFLENDIVIAPTFNTVVFFRSDLILHRVLPSKVPRYCFTIWIDSSDVNTPEDLNLRSSHLSLSKLTWLQRSPVQRVLSRAIYPKEYESSLIECMKSADAVVEMLAAHEVGKEINIHITTNNTFTTFSHQATAVLSTATLIMTLYITI